MESTATPIASEPVEQPVRRTNISLLRRWTSFGTGVGVSIGPENLEVVLVEVKPSGIRVLDAIEMPRYRERPAAEWGAEFAAFLQKHKLKHLAAVVVLPAREVVSRTLTLAGVADRELASAVQYQLDGLHPFPEGEVAFSFARLPHAPGGAVALGIARTEAVNEYATFFEEAGIDVAAFTTPAAAYYSALRILQLPPEEHFLATRQREDRLEIYAESATHPLYFVELEQESSRAIAMTISQVRLPAGTEPRKLAAQLPFAESTQPYTPLAYAAALAAALPRQSLAVNLLPEERRRVTSRWRWAPTLALLILAAAVAIALAFFQEYENRKLIAELEAESQRLAPRLARVKELEVRRQAAQRKLESFSRFVQHPKDDLDSLREVTRIVPLTAWITRFELTRNSATMSGEIEQAGEILRLIDDSPLFANTEFTAPFGRGATGREVFQIRSQREKPKSAAPAAPAGGPR
jgi:hypothetical protein